MDTAGLPDFGQPLAAGDAPAFAIHGGGSDYGVVADGFGLALGGDGQPLLALVLEKRADDLSAGSQGGVFDLTIAARYPLDAALAAARAADPRATVAALPIDLGFGRLVPAGAALGLDPATLTPQPLGWTVAEGARWTQRLDTTAAGLIKGAMQAGRSINL